MKNQNILRPSPDYKRIFKDIILHKFPEKEYLLLTVPYNKKIISSLDVIELNQTIFGKERANGAQVNHKYRAYKKMDILEILKFQKENRLNNKQLAKQFSISRNTISAWKKKFLI